MNLTPYFNKLFNIVNPVHFRWCSTVILWYNAAMGLAAAKKRTLAMGLLALFCCQPAFAQTTLPLQPQCFDPTGIRQVQTLHPELTAHDITLGMVELGQPSPDEPNAYAFMPNLVHQVFNDTHWGNFYYYDDPDRPVRYSAHATLIAALIAGRDQNAYMPQLGSFEFRGAGPDITLNIYEAHWFLYKRALAQPAESIDDDILTISWGSHAEDAVAEWWQRAIDALVKRENCIIVAGCGNGDTTENTITKPAAGRNIISVGSAQSLGSFPYCLSYVGWSDTSLTSSGPTADGRTKPDLIAPGLAISPDVAQFDQYTIADDLTAHTSFAAPQVAAVAALLLDAANQNNIPNAKDPRLIKAILLNSADKLAGWHKGALTPADDHDIPLDYIQGAGLLNAYNAHQLLITPPDTNENSGWRITQLALDTNDPNSERLYTLPSELTSDRPFKATLCWLQRYQSNKDFSALPAVDLSLELWSVDEQNNPIELLDYSDSKLDNLEHIYYTSAQNQKAALLIRVVSSSDKADTIPCAVAWSDQDINWSGDRFRGDLNADGVVDIQDARRIVQTWLTHPDNRYLTQGPAYPEDLNLDGRVNNDDFDILRQSWQFQSPWR